MFLLWGILAGLSLWLELVYHFCGYGWTLFHPIYVLPLIVAWSGVTTLLIGIMKGRLQKVVYYTAIWVPAAWTGAQLVYLHIFKCPLLWDAVVQGGQNALSDYWREALSGIREVLPAVLLLLLPAVVLPVLLRKQGWKLPRFTNLQMMHTLAVIVAGTTGILTVLGIGKITKPDFYEELQEFYDPLTVAENFGVLPLFHADMASQGRKLLTDLQRSDREKGYAQVVSISSNASRGPIEAGAVTAISMSMPDKAAATSTPAENPVIRPQQFPLDYALLHQLADNKRQSWLADYIEGQQPVNTNAYTGMFKGYNLIFLTAESFCPYAIDEKLTPTLYKLANSGFVCENYYVPLWYTSTSDGEYVNMTGLIPDGQFSMRNSAANAQPFALPAYFAKEGVHSYAYHDNSLSYYSRHLSHINMGYDFKACRLGKLEEAQWGSRIFDMEQPEQWPASDYNMMVATVPEYVKEERFHVYYMTVSGHMKYDFTGNAMSGKNKDLVAGLELSEGPRAYIACNIELDKAMENLLTQLEAAGQLDKTVICLSADHYPYGLSDQEYTELAGRDLSYGKDKYRNTLILWNAAMPETVYIDKPCSCLDLLPTLLNLFGFEYDSRMYAGRDILSDRDGLVIFNNRDFVTDSVIFTEKGDIATWLTDENGNHRIPDEKKEAYLEAIRQEVKERYQFSSYILQENYYSDVQIAVLDNSLLR